MMKRAIETKKQQILVAARALGATKFTPAEIEQIRRRLIAQHGEEGKTSTDYIASVLQQAGQRVLLSKQADSDEQYEEQFQDLLHFSTLDEAEMCIIRLDELLRKFRGTGERAAAERVLEVGRLGRRRAEMIAHNRKVEEQKRAEKAEIAKWFGMWLATPEMFFDWLEVRKGTEEYRQLRATSGDDEEE